MIDVDSEGFLRNLGEWTPEVAQHLAVNEDINLTPAHWDVIHVLRDFYTQTDTAPSMRPFVNLVKSRLGSDVGSSIHLMGLFGGSPAKMAAKIAGLPRPTNCL